VLSRQDLPTLDRNVYASAARVARGAYVLADTEGVTPDVLLLASGSEVAPCVTALRSFGLSAPGKVAQSHFGFDVEHVVATARRQVALHPGPGRDRQGRS
jgi:transketolase